MTGTENPGSRARAHGDGDVCCWCGKTEAEHVSERAEGAPQPRVPCLGLKIGFMLRQPEARPTFRDELASLINRWSKESGSNTPDFLLAEYIDVCLTAFDRGVQARDAWYGRAAKPGVTTNTVAERPRILCSPGCELCARGVRPPHEETKSP